MSGSRAIEGFARNLAFLVAIDHYAAGVPKLRTPVADAKALAQCLSDDHGFETELVLDSAATLAGLRTFFADLPKRVGCDDRVLFYFAGHGTATPGTAGPTGYILPHDAERESNANYLPMVELNAALCALPCRHMLAILDCCFAGALQWASSTRYLALAPEHLHQERYKWFISDPAWQAIASAAYDQKAIDVAAEQPLGQRGDQRVHSPFASALISGLKGFADRAAVGQTGDGVITATELYQHLDETLQPKVDGAFRQTPIFWPLKKHDKGQFIFLVPGKALDLPPAPPLDLSANPWRGLEPYDTKHSELFYGRRTASEELAQRVKRDRFVVVAGPSGIGKSSLVRAGLLPRLSEGTKAIVVRPGAPGPTPFASLAAAVKDATAAPQSPPNAHDFQTRPEALADWVTSQGQDHEILLVIDQAEELITMGSEENAADSFLKLIRVALDQTETLRVVLTVRSEFEPQLAQTALKARWPAARYLVPQMTQDELRRVIEGPAAVKVMRFESADLVEVLVNDVANMPGALPLLSFALSQMYFNYLSRQGDDRAITQADYDALEGGVTGSLRVRANQVVDGVDEAQKQTARRVLERLVSVESGLYGRRRVPRREFTDRYPLEQKRIEAVLKRLDEERLVVSDQFGDVAHIELAHDALILGWDRLHNWVRQDQALISDLRRLSPDAEAWSATANAGLLWDDPVRIGAVRELQRATVPGLNTIETRFADASLRRARRNRNVRWGLTIALATFALGAAVASGLLYVQRGETVRQADLANHQAMVAKANEQRALEQERLAKEERDNVLIGQSRFLADQAMQKLNSGDATTATLLALEALPDPDQWNSARATPEAEKSLLAAVYRDRETLRTTFPENTLPIVGKVAPRVAYTDATGAALVVSAQSGKVLRKLIPVHSKALTAKEFSQGDDLLLTLDFDAIRIWDLPASKQIFAFPTEKVNTPQDTVFCPDSSRIAVLFFLGGNISIVDTSSAKILSSLEGGGYQRFVKCDSTGQRILAYGGGTDVTLLDTVNGRQLANFGSNFSLDDPIFSSDGSRLLLRNSSEMNLLRLVDVATGNTIIDIAGSEAFSAWKFSPDGGQIVTGANDGTIQIWNAKTGELLKTLNGHGGSVSSLSLRQSTDGTLQILSGSDDRTARVWDGKTGQELSILQAHTVPIVTVDFRPIDPDTELDPDHPNSLGYVLTADKNGEIRRWNLDNPRLPQEDNLFRTSVGPIGNAVFNANGSGLIVTTKNNVLTIWSLRWRPPNNWSRLFAFTPDGRTVAQKSGQGIDVIDVATGKKFSLVRTDKKDTPQIGAFSPDGGKLATSWRSKDIIIWDVKAAKPLFTFAGPDDADGIAVSADGRLIAISSDRHGAKVYDWSGNLVIDLSRISDHNRRVALSPDGRQMAVVEVSSDGFADGDVLLVELPSGIVTSLLPADQIDLWNVAYSPDGMALFAGSTHIVRRWDLRTLAHRVSERLLSGRQPDRLSIDPTGKRLVFGDALLDATTLEILWQGSDKDASTIGSALTTAGALSFSSGEPSLQPFFVDARSLVSYARALVPACLSVEERRPPVDKTPPDWCITGANSVGETDPAKWLSKWPFDTSTWRSWLVAKRSGAAPPTMPQ